MNIDIKKVTLKVGLASPVKLLLTADNHISYADAREGDAEREHARSRNIDMFSLGKGEWALAERLGEIAKYARENCDALVMAGDVMDHPSRMNFEIFRDAIKGNKFVYAVGNHDFNFPNTENITEALLDSRTELFREYLGCAPYNNSLQVGGLNIVALNDVFDRFDKSAVTFLKEELKRNMPTFLLFHVPLYAEKLIDPVTEYWKRPLLVGCPDEVIAKYSQYMQPTNEATSEILRLIAEDKNIVGTLAGHVHFDYENILPSGKTQIVCRAGAFESATEITVL